MGNKSVGKAGLEVTPPQGAAFGRHGVLEGGYVHVAGGRWDRPSARGRAYLGIWTIDKGHCPGLPQPLSSHVSLYPDQTGMDSTRRPKSLRIWVRPASPRIAPVPFFSTNPYDTQEADVTSPWSVPRRAGRWSSSCCTQAVPHRRRQGHQMRLSCNV